MSKKIFKPGLKVEKCNLFTEDEWNNLLLELHRKRDFTKTTSAVSGKSVTVKITPECYKK